ncbi:neurogenic locus notch homolog protein 1-like [Dreissena polymorpha]|uniref:neurogenic locus notch homolog protein 1-like n=1 Tax=Dreissena polymorpha TaxID=45954 RepID=UPI0022646570|nr:neurogenic locus notch homolog protein 1-like [Dreissena polymorpha]
MTCESHESCYADAFENPNGDIVFNLGCRDRQLCGSFGKREVVTRSNGNTQLCAQCCFGNLCNAALCGQTGLPSVGPVCFKCDQANTPSSCNTIALCGRDDVCHVEKTIGSLTHATLYKSGCLHKTNCDRHAQSLSLIGRKRYDNTVMSDQGPCTGSPCIHGRCFESSTDYACQCENGWQGKNCDQNSKLQTT